MSITPSIALSVLESSQIGEARRRAAALTSQLGFGEVERGQVGIVVTELATNLVHHANGGSLIFRELEQAGQSGLEILSLDQGPGLVDIDACLQDGFSTAGTPGNGLGAVQRLSQLFDVYSVPGQGTAILCQLWHTPPKQASVLEVGGICLPQAGEAVSGDAWAVQGQGERHQLLVADGLGHGPQAAAASLAAVHTFQEQEQQSPPQILEGAHAALRSTRGAAVAIAELDLENQTVCYAGVGNIAGAIVQANRSTSLVSYNGTVGHELRKIQAFTYAWSPYSLLIMHSDGLGTQWRLDAPAGGTTAQRHPGLINRHPSLVAGVLYRDFYRGRDDVTVVVVRQTR